MNGAELARRIDHTVLGPATTPASVERVLDEARRFGMNACIPPCYVDHASEYAPEVTLATVVGFPHGHHVQSVKVAEAETAWRDGADELDVVINVGRLLAGETDTVGHEIEEIVAAVPVPVKVIVETALLDEEAKRDAAVAARDAGAEFVKTSTGFAETGATIEDVELLSEYLPVKASGGIDTFLAARTMIEAGADRLGTSSGVEILEELRRNRRE